MIVRNFEYNTLPFLAMTCRKPPSFLIARSCSSNFTVQRPLVIIVGHPIRRIMWISSLIFPRKAVYLGPSASLRYAVSMLFNGVNATHIKRVS